MLTLFKILQLISLGALCTATPLYNGSRYLESSESSEFVWPTSYIALGDSYAAGVGAGNYVQPRDKEIKKCKRTDGSYPSQVKDLVGIQQFDFVACSGKVLGDLKKQYEILGDKRAELVTLSIGGNDFRFANTVENCVYHIATAGAWGKLSDMVRDGACQAALKEARDLVEGDGDNGQMVWTKYEEEVDRIVSERLSTTNPNAVLIITGYSKFFATPQEKDDLCVGKRFPIYKLKLTIANRLHKEVREEMNRLVHQVNTQIRNRIVSRHPGKIIFIDNDSLLEGHRFCESNPEYQVPARFLDSDNVYFYSLRSEALEDEGRSKVFHPKTQAHNLTAQMIKMEVMHRFNGMAAPAPVVLTT